MGTTLRLRQSEKFSKGNKTELSLQKKERKKANLRKLGRKIEKDILDLCVCVCV